jgi:hypothetical protein
MGLLNFLHSTPPGWLEVLVWGDFKVAVIATVFVPLALLVWAAFVRFPSLNQVLVAYWKISSLLAITVYLMMGGFPLSFLTGVAARILIPVSLWFWTDLTEAIAQDTRWVCRSFRLWRWLVTVYMGVGTIFSGVFLPCGFQPAPVSTICQVWFQPPLRFQALFHPNIALELLSTVGILTLIAYVSILALSLKKISSQQTEIH